MKVIGTFTNNELAKDTVKKLHTAGFEKSTLTLESKSIEVDTGEFSIYRAKNIIHSMGGKVE